jgi:predicted small secreted protein
VRAALLLAALLLAACATSPGGVEQQVRAIEQAQARAAVAGDRAALEKIFAPGFRLINPSGAIASREELLTMLGGGKPPYSAATYVTDSVLVQGRRAAVATGTESVVYAATGERQQRRITQVWQRGANGWQLVLRQATLVAAPK